MFGWWRGRPRELRQTILAPACYRHYFLNAVVSFWWSGCSKNGRWCIEEEIINFVESGRMTLYWLVNKINLLLLVWNLLGLLEKFARRFIIDLENFCLFPRSTKSAQLSLIILCQLSLNQERVEMHTSQGIEIISRRSGKGNNFRNEREQAKCVRFFFCLLLPEIVVLKNVSPGFTSKVSLSSIQDACQRKIHRSAGCRRLGVINVR